MLICWMSDNFLTDESIFTKGSFDTDFKEKSKKQSFEDQVEDI